MPQDPEDPDDLIDAGEVAAILGLAHRNSVSTYRTRYEDFPPGQPSPGGGRTRLWPRGEILAWHHRFRAREAAGADEPSDRLEALVAATVRIMLANPGRDVSIREIAAEAGVAHSDLYRHAGSKEQLVALAVAQIEATFAQSMPADPVTFLQDLPAMLTRLRATRAAMLVVTDRAIANGDPTSDQTLGVQALAALVNQRRQAAGTTSTVDPRVLAAATAGLLWGLMVLEPRWLHSLGLEEIPDDQVATIVRALFDL